MAAETNPTPTDDGPTAGHDPEALADAERKMGIKTPDDAKDTSAPSEDDGEIPGDHDQAALDDAARKMGIKH